MPPPPHPWPAPKMPILNRVKIQKFSLSISRWVRVPLDLEVFVNWSIMVNFACLLKFWLICWKYLQTIIASTFFTSFRWLFSHILKLVSAFPTYCLLHEMHPIKYITKLLAQLTLWNILYIFLVCWLLKTVFFRICLQKNDLKFVRHGEHLLGFSFCICLFLTSFFSILLLRINSLRFLFHLNAIIGWYLNTSSRDSIISSQFQCFRITLLMFGHKWL